MKSVMIIGIGYVGSWALEMLARTPGVERIVAADINDSYASRRAKAAQCGAAHLGFYPEILFQRLDASNVEQTAGILKHNNPTVILSTLTLISPYAASDIPKDKGELVKDAGLGPFLPCHLLLQYRLMQAVDQAGIDPKIVDASFPDAIIPILHRAGCRAPDLGLGNLDNLVPVITMQVAKRMNTNMRSVRVYLVSHHINNVWFSRQRPDGMPPYWMKILVNDQDVTDQFDTDELMLNTSGQKNRLSGTDGSSLTASSGVKHALALLSESDLFTHSPGVKGLVGGYPVRISAKKIEIALPDGITLEEAIEINKEGQYRDGIEEIKDDGTAIFTDEAVGLMKETIGYECKSMTLDEVEGRAKELLSKFREAAGK